jgi:DNA-binding NarL/FixJ family response regulator
VVADAHPAVRGAVRLSCAGKDTLEVVAEAATAQALIESCRRTTPDAVVLDLDLPDGDGLDAIRTLREEGLASVIVVLTDRTDGSAVLTALRLGVNGYLVKASGLPTVGERLARALGGERVVSPELESVTISELGRMARRAREGSEISSRLTGRERQVLAFIGRGLTMRQVATRLGISPKTVETHAGRLYRKLGVRTRVQAVARAASLGLIELRRSRPEDLRRT